MHCPWKYKGLFLDMLYHFHTVILASDGLDECESCFLQDTDCHRLIMGNTAGSPKEDLRIVREEDGAQCLVTGHSLLLNLPESLQQEVVSWISDSVSANALLRTCKAMQGLRRDPAMAALLLWRFASNYCSGGVTNRHVELAQPPCQQAVESFEKCDGGLQAVVRCYVGHVQTFTSGGGDLLFVAGVTFTILVRAIALDESATVHILMKLIAPDIYSVISNCALHLAVAQGRLATMRVLLELGVDPAAPGLYRSLDLVDVKSHGVAPLQLMLEYSPSSSRETILLDYVKKAYTT